MDTQHLSRSFGQRLSARFVRIMLPCLGVALALAGCGPAVQVAAPSNWPAEWNGRRLFNTPNAYIYASTSAAAGEADRLVQATASKFEERGGAVSKGLVIVTDISDPPITADAKRFGEALCASANTTAQTRPATDWHSDLQHSAEFLKVPPEQAMLVGSFGIPVSAISAALQLPDPPADVAWAIAIPTRALSNRVTDKGLRKLMTPPNGAFEWVRFEAMWMMLRTPYRALAATQVELDIFEQLADADSSWSQTRRDEEERALRTEMLDQRLGMFKDPKWWP